MTAIVLANNYYFRRLNCVGAAQFEVSSQVRELSRQVYERLGIRAPAYQSESVPSRASLPA